MENFFNSISEIKSKAQKYKSFVFVFDFDGTLAKIAPTPDESKMEKSTEKLLEKLSKKHCVAVLSGRSLTDIKSRARIRGIIHAGNHGFEWQIKGKKGKIKVPKEILKNLSFVKKQISSLAKEYKGSRFYDKKMSLSLHYRLLNPLKQKEFLKEAKKVIKEIESKKGIEVFFGKKVIEARPMINWNKGYFIKFLQEQLKNKIEKPALYFYAGDDTTDEDAFRYLKNGITVRVGKRGWSHAKYFIKEDEIDKFLNELICACI